MLLNTINSPKDLKSLSVKELQQIAAEIRSFILDIVALKEGHLGAGLGVVELTLAIHKIFNTPFDQLIWDVGHQCYPHKIITGRKSDFETLRQWKGISGFPVREESKYDTFGTAHSSTSISAVLGMAMAAQLNEEYQKQHIAVIGDASIANGMAFEAMNHAGATNANVLIILNDNAMGIDPSVGALKDFLSHINLNKRIKRGKSLFEAVNIDYYGPVDGHNFEELIPILEELKTIQGVKLLHVKTRKGKGYSLAENDQITWHSPGQFNVETGERKLNENLPPKYQDVFGETMLDLAKINSEIVGITPAMPTGSSLKYMIGKYPERAFDVGIAEEHAVTFAAGLATQNKVPYLTIYSTFLQRAYDQLIHDVALQKLPLILCVDRAGLIGNDGATHQGYYDLAFLNLIPNTIIAAPSNLIELRQLLYTAQFTQQIFAIRYPRGRGEELNWKQPFESLKIGVSKEIVKGKKVAILAIGKAVNLAQKAILDNYDEVTLINMIFLKPFDKEKVKHVFQEYKTVITVEDGIKKGGLASTIGHFAEEQNYKGRLHHLGIPDEFIFHGSTQEQLDYCGYSSAKISDLLKRILNV